MTATTTTTPADAARRFFGALRELAGLCDPAIFEWNPIAVYEALSRRDDLAYCPFAYGYSNYSRAGYSENLLIFTDMVAMDGKLCLGASGLCFGEVMPWGNKGSS